MEDAQNPFANLDEETQRQIQEIQVYEQGFQQLLMQKKNFQFESEETGYAIKELDKTEGEVFKIIAGQVVVKSNKEDLLSEMKNKKELIESRLKDIEKQEERYSKKIEEIRENIMKKLTPKKTK
jgi:prefoldin beta subunit